MHKIIGRIGLLVVLVVLVVLDYLYSPPPPAQATVGDVTIDQSVGGTFSALDMVAQKLSDSANTAYFIDPAASGNSLVTAGDATVSGNIALGNTKTIRSAFGPLSLQYKSALDTWATGLTLQDTTGNVGIGTTTPASKLTVAGTVESTTGGFKFPDATTQTSAATGMTSGMIAAFETSCPSGWTEYTAGRGRVIVGMPLSGTSGGTVGTALTNLEDRTHTHTGPSHTHTYNQVIAHTHTITTNSANANTPNVGGGNTDAFNTASTNSTGIATGTTAASGTGATSATSVTMPYLQLLWCKKD